MSRAVYAAGGIGAAGGLDLLAFVPLSHWALELVEWTRGAGASGVAGRVAGQRRGRDARVPAGPLGGAGLDRPPNGRPSPIRRDRRRGRRAWIKVYLGSLVTSASQLISGAPKADGWGRAFYWGGLLATLGATIILTRVARAALTRELDQTQRPREERP